jgi:hypothetical protein
MNAKLKSTIAVLALMSAAPAASDIQDARASASQGTTVHGNGGAADVGTDVTANLGEGPSAPEIVHFTGNTTVAGDVNELMLQQGAGQAQLTGTVTGGNTTAGLISGNIFLTDHAGMDWIELALFGATGGTINFTLSGLDANGNPEADTLFSYLLDPNGSNRFAFQALNGEAITNLAYNIDGGSAEGIRQVRITPAAVAAAVPEASSWAMMLMGFGAAGLMLRRKRRVLLTQIA